MPVCRCAGRSDGWGGDGFVEEGRVVEEGRGCERLGEG